MPYAQLPSPPQAELGGWIVCLAGILGVLWIGRQLFVSFFPTPKERSEAERYVTQEQFALFRSEIKAELNDFKHQIVGDLDKSAIDLRTQLRDMTDYMHKVAHDNTNSINAVIASLAWLKGALIRNDSTSIPSTPIGQYERPI